MFCFIPWIVLLHFAESSLQTSCPDNPWSNLGCTADCVNTEYGYIISSCPVDTLPANTKVFSESFRQVEFFRSRLTTIKNFAFHGISIYNVIFAHSFTTVEAKAFSGIKDVSQLFFVNNQKLTSLPKGVFKNLTKLVHIGLLYNGLIKIHGDIFAGMNSLETINLYGNKFTCLPYNLLHNVTVTIEIVLAYLHEIQDDLNKYGVNQTQNVEFDGLCAQSFRNFQAKIQYEFQVDKCVKECSSGGKGLNVIPSTEAKHCDCCSLEGCLDDNCKPINADNVPTKQDNVPSTEDNVPSTQADNLPTKQDNVPTKQADTVPTKQADNLGTTPGNSNEGFAIPKTTLLPSRASQTILPGNLCLAIGVSLGVRSLVLLF